VLKRAIVSRRESERVKRGIKGRRKSGSEGVDREEVEQGIQTGAKDSGLRDYVRKEKRKREKP